MADHRALALEHVTKQAAVIRRLEGMLATAREMMADRVRSAEHHGASAQEIAEATEPTKPTESN